MKSILKITTFTLLAALGFFSCKKSSNDTTNLSTKDTTFLRMAAFSNLAEINFGQLALTKSANDSVKMFAQMMVNDHTKAMASLDSVATLDNFALPETIDSMHMIAKAQLVIITGNAFDSVYMAGQVKDHINTISLFQSESNNGDNLNLRSFATQSLPMLQMHLQMAYNVVAQLH